MISTSLYFGWAKSEQMVKLIRHETKRMTMVSMMNIRILVFWENRRSFLVWTSEEWRKMFWGMMMAPITPVKESDLGMLGTNPSRRSTKGGLESKKFTEKQISIIRTITPKMHSKLFCPHSCNERMPTTIIIVTANPFDVKKIDTLKVLKKN